MTNDEVDLAVSRAVEFIRARQRRDGQWISPAFEKDFPLALTALAAYTLHQAGAPISDYRLHRATRQLLDSADVNTVYARSFTLMLWCAVDPQAFQRQIEEDVRFLKLQQNNAGAWGYGTLSDAGPGKGWRDNCNSQLALVALAKAAAAGADVSPVIWRRAERSWMSSANPDGGWGYPLTDDPELGDWPGQSTGSMTAAGLASLYIIYDQLYLDAELPFNGRFKARCGEDIEKTRAIRAAIDQAWQWIVDNYRSDGIPGLEPEAAADPVRANLTHYLFGLSRAAAASGVKRIGSHVWYRDVAAQLLRTQQDDGSWGNVYQTCYGVLALLEGRTPVMINKLRYGVDNGWNKDPRAAANLTRWISRSRYNAVTWQTVDIDSGNDDWHDAPVLLISGHEAPQFTDVQGERLRDFVGAGGTVLAVACCSRPEFTEGCRTLFATLFPRLESGPLPADHPVWSLQDAVEAGDDVLGFSDGCRTSIFLLTNGACCAWQQNMVARDQRLFSLGGNILNYATFNQPLGGRLTPYLEVARGTPLLRIPLARLMHGGDWWAQLGALKHLSAALSKHTGLGLEAHSPVRAAEVGQSGARVLWITGYEFEPFDAAGREELEDFLEAGGTLVASACCGSEEFDRAFQSFAVNMFGAEAWERVDNDDPLMTGSFAPGLAASLHSMSYRRRYQAGAPPRLDWPILYGMRHEGRWAVIYSPHDVTYALGRHACLECVGYASRDARALWGNIMLYVATR